MTAFAHVKDARLAGLLAYYLDLRQGMQVPRRNQVSPLDFPHLLGNVFLYEVTGDGDYLIRLAGDEIARMLQTTRAGSRLSAVFPPDAFPLVAERFDRICETRSVMHNIGQVFHRVGGSGHGERIVMPLLDETSLPRFLLGATVYAVADGAAMPSETRMTGNRPAGDPMIVTFTPL